MHCPYPGPPRVRLLTVAVSLHLARGGMRLTASVIPEVPASPRNPRSRGTTFRAADAATGSMAPLAAGRGRPGRPQPAGDEGGSGPRLGAHPPRRLAAGVRHAPHAGRHDAGLAGLEVDPADARARGFVAPDGGAAAVRRGDRAGAAGRLGGGRGGEGGAAAPARRRADLRRRRQPRAHQADAGRHRRALPAGDRDLVSWRAAASRRRRRRCSRSAAPCSPRCSRW